MSQNRTPRGVPAGGQFSGSHRSESDVPLHDDTDLTEDDLGTFGDEQPLHEQTDFVESDLGDFGDEKPLHDQTDMVESDLGDFGDVSAAQPYAHNAVFSHEFDRMDPSRKEAIGKAYLKMYAEMSTMDQDDVEDLSSMEYFNEAGAGALELKGLGASDRDMSIHSQTWGAFVQSPEDVESNNAARDPEDPDDVPIDEVQFRDAVSGLSTPVRKDDLHSTSSELEKLWGDMDDRTRDTFARLGVGAYASMNQHDIADLDMGAWSDYPEEIRRDGAAALRASSKSSSFDMEEVAR